MTNAVPRITLFAGRNIRNAASLVFCALPILLTTVGFLELRVTAAQGLFAALPKTRLVALRVSQPACPILAFAAIMAGFAAAIVAKKARRV